MAANRRLLGEGEMKQIMLHSGQKTPSNVNHSDDKHLRNEDRWLNLPWERSVAVSSSAPQQSEESDKLFII